MPPISPERWRTLSPYLDEALEIEAAKQAAWLASISARDPALADDLRSILAGHKTIHDSGFLEGVVVDPRLTFMPSLAGQVLGSYRLLSPIGQGGSGNVWLAERCDGRFQGRAAVKLLNIALVERGGEARFKREGTILAGLRHPHIAHLVDAGISQTGQPYLVLEHVDGQPIDRYLRECRNPHRGAAAPVPRRARCRRPCPRQSRRPSRHQAGERARQQGRGRQAPRLRHRQADRARCATAVERRGFERVHARRRLGAHAAMRGPRAALGRRDHHRYRRLRARRAALRPAQRPASSRRCARLAGEAAAGDRRDGGAEAVGCGRVKCRSTAARAPRGAVRHHAGKAAAHAARRPRSDRGQGASEESRRALCLGRRVRRRPPPAPAARAGRRASKHAARIAPPGSSGGILAV